LFDALWPLVSMTVAVKGCSLTVAGNRNGSSPK
jgi:hypothetical protein